MIADLRSAEAQAIIAVGARAVTALTAGVMTVLFGLVTRLPFAFAAGLGINSFLAVAVVGQVTWPEAMGLVVINGLIIVLLAATGLRRMIFDAVPIQLKLAITVGIGRPPADHPDLQRGRMGHCRSAHRHPGGG